MQTSEEADVRGISAENVQEYPRPADEMTVEEAFAKLEDLAERLEEPEVSLEDSFALYRKGMELLKYCSQKLDTVEKKMLLMNEDGTLEEF